MPQKLLSAVTPNTRIAKPSSPDNRTVLSGEEIFHLFPVPPFRLDLTVWALRRRKENSYDCWVDDVYKRVLVIDGKPILVKIKQLAALRHPDLEITIKGMLPSGHDEVVFIIERMLGLKTNRRASITAH